MKGVDMTDDKKKHDDKDRKKVSDEELEDVAGGFMKLGDIKGEAVKKNKKTFFRIGDKDGFGLIEANDGSGQME
jgi:hypothetical protein